MVLAVFVDSKILDIFEGAQQIQQLVVAAAAARVVVGRAEVGFVLAVDLAPHWPQEPQLSLVRRDTGLPANERQLVRRFLHQGCGLLGIAALLQKSSATGLLRPHFSSLRGGHFGYCHHRTMQWPM